MPDFYYEELARERGFRRIAGVDEAGRGPLAGPVVAAAVILPEGVVIDKLDDSKKLSDACRRRVFEEVREKCLAYAVGIVDNFEIDERNIRNAAFYAMYKAVEGLELTADFVLVDGNAVKYIDQPHECIVGGDRKSLSIAAASVVAKVTRDDIMLQYDELYPEYGFAKHKGYPTVQHYEAIAEYGILPIHRLSFRLGKK